MNNEIYFCLRESTETTDCRVAFSDICHVYGADANRLADIYFEASEKGVEITAFDIAKELKARWPQSQINNLGPSKCSVFRIKTAKSKTFMCIKVIFLCVVMFFGGAIAIMTFHEDVSMRGVHSSIYAFFTGREVSNAPEVSIPYSLGITVGLVLIFGFFKSRKKRPTVLEIDIHQHEKERRLFMLEQNKRGDG